MRDGKEKSAFLLTSECYLVLFLYTHCLVVCLLQVHPHCSGYTKNHLKALRYIHRQCLLLCYDAIQQFLSVAYEHSQVPGVAAMCLYLSSQNRTGIDGWTIFLNIRLNDS